MNTALIAIDPGTNTTGVAVFWDGLLTNVYRLNAIKGPCARLRALSVADQIPDLICPTIVLEWPQVYRGAASKGDPNDLLTLAFLCGAIAATNPDSPIAYYKPAEWAGQLPKTKSKPWDSPRGKRIWDRLSAEERAVALPGNNDVIDAIGLGLHHLGRLKPKKAISRGISPASKATR